MPDVLKWLQGERGERRRERERERDTVRRVSLRDVRGRGYMKRILIEGMRKRGNRCNSVVYLRGWGLEGGDSKYLLWFL